MASSSRARRSFSCNGSKRGRRSRSRGKRCSNWSGATRRRSAGARDRPCCALVHRRLLLPLVNAAARGDPSARTVAATAEGEARINTIRADFAQLLEAERRTSAATARASARAAHRAYAGAVVGVGVSIALVALYAGYLTRAIVRPIRRAATLTGRLAGGDLAARLPETGVGEIGALQRAFNVMGASLERSRDELAALADEQAGLRRVATLVAQGASPDDVLAAVACEIGQLLPADYTLIGRYDVDGAEITIVGSWSRDGDATGFPATLAVGGRNLSRPRLADQTAGPHAARRGTLAVAPYGRALGIRSSVGVPINVEGHLWGIVIAASTRDEPMPDDTETRLGQLHRARLDRHRERRGASGADRIARTHHRDRRRDQAPFRARPARRRPADGSSRSRCRCCMAQEAVPPDLPELAAELDHAAAELTCAIDELRDFARGIHPAVLTEGGLAPALRDAGPPVRRARRSGRADRTAAFPSAVEVAAYYVVSEALTNAAKHAHASSVTVRGDAAGDLLRVGIRDDGVGGAEFGRGSGLVGLKDRVEALGGRDHIGERVRRGHIALDRIAAHGRAAWDAL